MSVTVELPDGLARRLLSEATRRGISVERLAVEALEHRYGAGSGSTAATDVLDAFIGSSSSGRTEPFDIHAARADLATRKLARGA